MSYQNCMEEAPGYDGRVFSGDKNMNEVLSAMRDPVLQKSSAFFRENARTLGKMSALEIRVREGFRTGERQRLVGADGSTYDVSTDENPVILTVIRAALPMVEGSLRVFEEAPVAFAAVARNEGTYDPLTGRMKIKISYGRLPSSVLLPDPDEGSSLEGQVLLVPDIMLATASSLIETYDLLTSRFGTPSKVIASACIAAKPGVERLLEAIPNSVIYAAAIDPTVDARGYIVPGLGDAGDLCFDGFLS